MTGPRITTAGVVLCVGGGRINIDGPAPVPGEESLGIPATPDEERAYAALVLKDGAVRITIEPADAPERTPVTLDRIKARLRAALERNMGDRVRSVPAGDIATDLTDEVASLIRESDAPEIEPPHGSALDYLAELKGLLNKTLDAYAVAGETDRDLRRCLSRANSASLAILDAQRGTR